MKTTRTSWTPWAAGHGPFNPNMALYTHIDHNYFHDHTTPTSNGGETIVLGAIGDTGDYQNLFSLVEYNLFANCSGDPEIVSVKSSSNTVRYNTVRTSAARCRSRIGHELPRMPSMPAGTSPSPMPSTPAHSSSFILLNCNKMSADWT